MRRLAPAILVVAWIVFLTLPIAFLLGVTAASLDRDGLAGVYVALMELIGERRAKWLFSGLWLAMNVVVFWRVMLSKKRHDLGPSVDLDD
jgi:hypothetical protein